MHQVVLQTDIPELELFGRGKVRDIYQLDKYLLIVTTDRISAFDVVMNEGIPYKGNVLTALSAFWFRFLEKITPTHFVTVDFKDIVKLKPELKKYESTLTGRSMLVKKSQVFPVECIVRGYLAGAGWKEYQTSQSVSGIKLPAGLKESEKLSEPIFTPSTKATSGHDEHIDFKQMKGIIGNSPAEILRERSLRIYAEAHQYAAGKGIIISDTKFEWGYPLPPSKGVAPESALPKKDEVILVDEVLTPDSSRFWPLDKYAPGKGQPSFDKQFLRDYLESIKWSKTPPPPKLPDEIIQKTSEKYLEAYARLTGQKLL